LQTQGGRQVVTFGLKQLRDQPPGGIVLRGPWPKESRVSVDGRVVEGPADEIRLLRTPAQVRVDLPVTP
jgi:hypothetical protein